MSPVLVIGDIAASCSRSNPIDGITGLLLCDGSHYIQAIEGEEDLVRRCAARIVRDPRHEKIDVIQHCLVSSRQFRTWSLDYGDVLRPNDGPSFLDIVKRDVARMTDTALAAMFVGFAKLAS